MDDSRKSVNAGVHATTGFEFQKHCALYIFLNNYDDFKDRKYFICIEHHDDIIICYQDRAGNIISVDSYQAKKSPAKWSINNDLIEIIYKTLQTGINLDTDIGHTNYEQSLFFSTNNTIELKVDVKDPQTGKKTKISNSVNEVNECVKFLDLEDPIRIKILDKLKEYKDNQITLNKSDKLGLLYIDLARKRTSQKEQLLGAFSKLFGNSVNDHSAAVDTLVELFRDVETFLNQGNKAKLLDSKKQVNSDEINKALKIITTKQKAYDLWRSEKNTICKVLDISILDQQVFVLNFDNSFDLFKDKDQVEHQRIYKFVSDNKQVLQTHHDESSCVSDLLSLFKKTKTTQLDNNQLKAVIFAAYIEMKE